MSSEKDIKINTIPRIQNVPTNSKILTISTPVITAANLTTVKLPRDVRKLISEPMQPIKATPAGQGVRGGKDGKKIEELVSAPRNAPQLFARILIDPVRLENSKGRVKSDSEEAYLADELNSLLQQINNYYKQSGQNQIKISKTKAGKIQQIQDYLKIVGQA